MHTTAVVDVKLRMHLAVGTQKPPEIRPPGARFSLTITVAHVNAAGEATLEVMVDRAELQAKRAAEGSPQETLRRELHDLEGRALMIVASPAGRIVLMTLKLPEDAPPQARASLESLRQVLTMLLVPLPDVPVGVGAQWVVRSKVLTANVMTDQIGDYKLLAINDKGAQLTTTVRQSAAQQTVSVPALPKGTVLRLQTWTGAGNAKIDWRDDRLVNAAQLRTSGVMTGTIEGAQRDSKPVNLELTIEARLRPNR